MKKISNKSKAKITIIINLFLVFALMNVSVYAWFASQTENRVDAYDIQVGANSDLELSLDGNKWAGSLDLSDKKNALGSSIIDNLKLIDVTSDGDTFSIPELIQKENYAEVNTNAYASWTPAQVNQDYLEFDLKMRSKSKMSVYLSSKSGASPASAVVTGENCGNPSTYATGSNTFSRDCIVGALRVSFENADKQRYIWITNPEYHLNNLIGSPDYTMDANAGATAYPNGSETGALGHDFFWNNPKVHYYYAGNVLSTFDSNYTLSKLPDTSTNNPSEITSTKLAILDGEPDENGYYQKTTTFRVWIEGCDTEARRALVSGKFNLALILDTFELV